MSKKEPTLADAIMFGIQIYEASEKISELLNKIGVITNADEIEEFVYTILDRRIDEANSERGNREDE